MFGLSKREQRWKAEQKAAESLITLAAVAIKANADVEIAKAKAKEAEALKRNEPILMSKIREAEAKEKADDKCKLVDDELTERKSTLFSCLMVGDVFIRTDTFGEKDVCMKITEQSNGHNSVYLYGSQYKGRLCTTCDEKYVISL